MAKDKLLGLRVAAEAIADDLPIWVYDAEDEAPLDRYTIIFNETGHEAARGGWVYDAIAAGPGVNQHVEAKAGDHLGKSISYTELPVELQEQIFRELETMNPAPPVERGDPSEPVGLHEGAAGAAPALDPNAGPKAFIPRKPTQGEMEHERKRFNSGYDSGNIDQYLERRLATIRDPQKLFAFALMCEQENFHTFNQKVFAKLKQLGWDGAWPKGASAKTAAGQHNWVIEGKHTVCSHCGVGWSMDIASNECSKSKTGHGGGNPNPSTADDICLTLWQDSRSFLKTRNNNGWVVLIDLNSGTEENIDPEIFKQLLDSGLIKLYSQNNYQLSPAGRERGEQYAGQVEVKEGSKTAEAISNEVANAGVAIDGGMITMAEGTAPAVSPMETMQHRGSKEAAGGPPVSEEAYKSLEGAEFIAVTRGSDPKQPGVPKIMYTDSWDPASEHSAEQLAKIFTPKGRYEFYLERDDNYTFVGEGPLKTGNSILKKLEAEFGKWEERGFDLDEGEGEAMESSVKEAGPMDVDNPEGQFGNKLEPFTELDWNGLAGAESWADGTVPFLGEAKVINWPEDLEQAGLDGGVLVIVDAKGISLQGENGAYNYDVQDKDAAVAMANGLLQKQPIDASKLEDAGWEPINMPSTPEPATNYSDMAQASDKTADQDDELYEQEKAEHVMNTINHLRNVLADESMKPLDRLNRAVQEGQATLEELGNDFGAPPVEASDKTAEIMGHLPENKGQSPEFEPLTGSDEKTAENEKDTPCQGGCGKRRSVIHSDDPKDWLCNDCRTKKKAGPLNIGNPDKQLNPEPEVDAAANAIWQGMKDHSIHGGLEIDTANPEFRAGISEMLKSGFQFTPENVKTICWPIDEDGTGQDNYEQRLVKIPGYTKVDEFLNSYYQ